ncbi:MAG: sigma-54-dependent Fis family transcriptional regulator [Alphaproteobacteria bacterium]|nr:sigma-54-dependent Fis family transcriptional regulator [Alphaproteobacteria bacterium]
MRILVVDDNRSSADALARALSKRGEEATAVYDGATAITRIEASPPELVLTDLKMEPVGGMEVLRAAREQRPPVEVIVFTAYGAIETAVTAMQMGAHDFLTKPVTLEQLVHRIDAVRDQAGATTTTGEPPSDDVVFFASAPASATLLDRLHRVAEVPSHVWLEGEIGAGRGHAAMVIHDLSGSTTPLITVDVARGTPWPEAGTVLLPNVDDLPLDLQRDLARRLHTLPEGVRVIATASPEAAQKAKDGRLLPELYFELAVIVIPVPPLRDRQEDILPVLASALTRFATRYRREVPTVDANRQRKLLAHTWPGNLRELLNLAERAVVLGPDALDLHVIRGTSTSMPELEEGFSLSAYLEDVERSILVEALRRTGNDRTAMGRLLNVERNTLRYKLNKYGLLDR